MGTIWSLGSDFMAFTVVVKVNTGWKTALQRNVASQGWTGLQSVRFENFLVF